MRRPTSFDKECQSIADMLHEINPSGVNPLRTPGPCVDCGRITRNDYICDACKVGHVAPVRGA